MPPNKPNVEVVPLRGGTTVTNIVGSSVSKAKKGSHKRFYTDNTGYWPATCCAEGCNGPAQDGGHVKVWREGVFTWYLVPVCHGVHNTPKSTTTFTVKHGTVAVEDPVSFKNRVESWAHDYRYLMDRAKQIFH
ncbi:hypothetical protein V8C86DRAFT_61442 [Haematococcus lacustris]|nr:hypothetical protein QJQ45_012506 [Haematococcus lacustris]